MLTINSLEEAEKFVSRQQGLGNDVRWDGWDIVFFRPVPQAVYSTEPEAVIRGGSYGFDNRSVVTDEGTWNIDFRNVRRIKRTART